jgi:hypothetical protein
MHCRRFEPLNGISRREWLQRSAFGLGGVALSSLLEPTVRAGAVAPRASGGRADLPHFAAKAKRVLFLFMSGGMSQFESFDPKPILRERMGQPLPESVFKGRKPLGMSKNQATFPLIGSPFPFAQHGQSGVWMSDRFLHLSQHADKLCFLKGMVSEAVNHDPAMAFIHTGAQLPGRPSMGAWASYGLGSENETLPAFIVLVTRKQIDQPLSTRLWDSGFLPSQFQGTQFRAAKDAVLYLSNPDGVPPELQRAMLDRLREVHEDEFRRRGEAEIASRIAQYEMAFRMQTSVPEVNDLSAEPAATLDRYGPDVRTPGTYASSCVLGRRLIERGVRFVQIYHPGWDHHSLLSQNFVHNANEVDQPTAALLTDLEERGLLDDTLVIFGSEFGRTCYSQGTGPREDRYGREHHRDAFTMWMAGAGVKAGFSYGQTDEFGFDVVSGRTTVNDLHATMLHLLGIDHERFTFRFQGRDFRLTDVAGEVIKDILS